MSAGRWLAAGVAGVLVTGMVAFEMDEVEVVCGPDPSSPAAFAIGERVGTVGKVVHRFTEGDAPSTPEVYRTVMGGIGTIGGWLTNFDSTASTGRESQWQTGWRVENDRRRAVAIASCCPTSTPPPSDDQPAPEAPKPPEEWDPKWASYAERGDWQPGQLAIARVIISVGKAKGVPERGWTIAAATGLVESEMRNLTWGDRDSEGYLQQRPSQGWGSSAQVRDVRYATAKFYEALLRVPGWEQLPMGAAAQRVQRSAFPDRYATRLDDARSVLAAAGGDSVTPAPRSTPNIACESQSTTEGDAVPRGGGPVPGVFNRQRNPRTAQQAARWVEAMVANRTPITPNMCARYMAQAYGHPNSGCYPDGGCTAIGLWNAIPADLKHPGTGDPPRGALVWWRTKNSARHIAMSLGNGKIGTTDAPEGRFGILDIEEMDRWGPRIGWAAPHWPIHQGAAA